jgi:hypothetical protein
MPRMDFKEARAARWAFDAAEDLRATAWTGRAEDEAAATSTLLALYRHSASCSLASLGEAVDAPPPQPLDAERQRALELLLRAEEPQRAARQAAALPFRRVVLGAAAALGLLGLGAIGRALLTPIDVARGHPWSASSKLADCHPEVPECNGVRGVRLLFHTLEEESPWFRWDLESEQPVGGLTVVNRQDEALERALPLLVELSRDGVIWREVARREERFEVWRPRFEPQPARFVRLRVPRKTFLHLESVAVHR